MAATEAAPAAAETAPLEETPPRLLLFVVAFSLAATVVVALVLGLCIGFGLHLALSCAPPRVPDGHQLGAVEEGGLLDPGGGVGLEHVVDKSREDCGLLHPIQLSLHVVIGL